jgi:hypothetical protein
MTRVMVHQRQHDPVLSLTVIPHTQPATNALRLRGGLGGVDADQVLKYATGVSVLNSVYIGLAPEKGAEVLAREQAFLAAKTKSIVTACSDSDVMSSYQA